MSDKIPLEAVQILGLDDAQHLGVPGGAVGVFPVAQAQKFG